MTVTAHLNVDAAADATPPQWPIQPGTVMTNHRFILLVAINI
jgi:hypothetical protein